MHYSQVTQPVWANAAKSAVDCTVTFAAHGPVPFTASAADATAHSQDIFARCVAGEFGPVGAYTAPPAPPEPPAPPAPAYVAHRRAAYIAEADPLFFMSQRGEATQAQWLDKVAEIKARWPA